MDRRKEVNRRIQAVARAMRESWNPIGFDDEIPVDEYDSYAPVVVGMFERGESDEAVAGHLAGIERDSMGLTPRSPSSLLPVVRVLRAAT